LSLLSMHSFFSSSVMPSISHSFGGLSLSSWPSPDVGGAPSGGPYYGPSPSCPTILAKSESVILPDTVD
jgi:hypothetical protein